MDSHWRPYTVLYHSLNLTHANVLFTSKFANEISKCNYSNASYEQHTMLSFFFFFERKKKRDALGKLDLGFGELRQRLK